jgi:hypothetical protein
MDYAIKNKIAANVKFITKERTFTTKEIMASIAKNPERVSKLFKQGLSIEADSMFLDWVHNTPFGPFVDDDGEVIASGFTGFEEALIVIAVVGTLTGLAAGYVKGYYDGLEDGQATTDTSDDGNAGDSGDPGGDTEGGEDGE